MNENSTLQMLREELKKETGILPENQKITFRGIMKDNEKSLKDLKVGDGAKLMMLGSKVEDVQATTAAASKISTTEVKSDLHEEKIEENPNDVKEHQKHLAEKPVDICEAIPGTHQAIPPGGLKGLKNKVGVTIRLSIKGDEVSLSSASSTQKVPVGSFSEIKTWPIKGHEDYQVPSQYLRSIKVSIMGWGI